MFVIVIPIPEPKVTGHLGEGAKSPSGPTYVEVDAREATAAGDFIDKLVNNAELKPYIKEVAFGKKGTECVIAIDPMVKAGGQ